jgi:hypothetical protein
LSLKNRVGSFCILFGFIGLLIFGATVLAPPGEFDLWAFVAGAAMLAVGLRFRMDKSGPPIVAPPPRAPAGMPAKPKAAKGKGQGQGGPPPGPPPKKRGPLGTIFKGPANAKTAPKGPPGAGAGGRPGGGGGKGGAPGGGKPRK